MLQKQLLLGAAILSLGSTNVWAVDANQCIANYDGQDLHVPCVKINNQNQVYTVNLTSHLSGDQLSFNLQDFAPLTDGTTPATPVTLPEGVTIDSIDEVSKGYYPGSGHMQVVVRGTLPNYCYQITNWEQLYQPIEHDGAGNYQVNLSIESTPECYTDPNYPNPPQSFEVQLGLKTFELEHDSYTLKVNNAVTKTITPAFKEGALPEVKLADISLYINPQDPLYPNYPREVVSIDTTSLLASHCETIAHTREFENAIVNGITVGANNTINLPLRTVIANSQDCSQISEPNVVRHVFQLNTENVPAGEYQIVANGQTLNTVFIGTPLSEGINTNIDNELLISARNMEVQTTEANQTQLKIMGSLRNTCQTLANPVTAVSPNAAGHFEIVLRSNPLPTNTLCKYDYVPYDIYVPLDTTSLAAGYHKVVVNGRLVTFFQTN
ncbi:hypothetical protein [Candidatus Albibeggiatoa sp. nov. NOAA]|uniref:hypothetical protein n=1 Tax=Candidatus Albibeggiatoa sp. nov. NOAA TaxID=3162724 RepID=UPI0032F8CACF|nr:hypothetical protein [Thiotrichaceae bacterium]